VRHTPLRRAAAAKLTVHASEHLSPHGLRAGLITEAYLKGAPDEQVAAYTRHGDLSPIAASQSVLKRHQARVEQAQAALDQAELNLSYTNIYAPQDGKVTRHKVDVGTVPRTGQQVFYVGSPVTWIVANFKETQLNRMRVGQHVTISVDADSKLNLHAASRAFSGAPVRASRRSRSRTRWTTSSRTSAACR